MKYWIDVLTPKQTLFFKPLVGELRQAGHQTLLTSRRYREVSLLAKRIGLKTTIIGHHGGKDLYGKLVASGERTLRLAELVKRWGPDCAVSFSSPECARVAYGLGVRHICINDSPHAESVAKLTLPLSSVLLTPWIIPTSAWTRYGIFHDMIIKYRALDPAAWLKRMDEHDEEPLQGLDKSKQTIMVRLEESFASYLQGVKKSPSDELLNALLHRFTAFNIVVLGRYAPQISRMKGKYGSALIIPKGAFIGYTLLREAHLFIGMGGTMTTEAALMGVPTISAYPGRNTYVERYLIREGLVVKPKAVRGVIRAAEELLMDERKRASINKKAEGLLMRMEDPISKIISTLKVLDLA